MVDPTDKDTKHIKDQSMGTEGYLEYTKEKEKGEVNQLDVGNEKPVSNWFPLCGDILAACIYVTVFNLFCCCFP